MLWAIRQNKRARRWVTLLLLLAQCVLFVGEAAHAATLGNQPDTQHHWLTQDAGDDAAVLSQAPLADDSGCDQCCTCHGHSGHLALITDLVMAAQAPASHLLPRYLSTFTPLAGNLIYRPPIV